MDEVPDAGLRPLWRLERLVHSCGDLAEVVRVQEVPVRAFPVRRVRARGGGAADHPRASQGDGHASPRCTRDTGRTRRPLSADPAVNAQKAFADLWFYSNPIFVYAK